MAEAIYTAVYKFDGDNSNLKSTIKENDSIINKSSQSLESTDKKTSSNASGRWVAFSSLASSAVNKAFNVISSTISSSIDSAIKRVDTLNNFPKVMESLGFSAEESQKSIDALSAGIDGLPTSLDGIVKNVQALTASTGNLASGTVNATSVGLAFNNMMLASGASADTADRAFIQFNQMVAKGKVDMQSWNSVAMEAPGQLRQIAETMLGAGHSANDLYDALQDGTVSMDDFMGAMVKLNEEGGENFGSFEEQARNATGGIGTAFENVGNRVSKALSEVINTIGQENIANAINWLSSTFVPIGKAVAEVIKFIGSVISTVFDVVKNVFNFITGNEVVLALVIATLITLGGLAIWSMLPTIVATLTSFGVILQGMATTILTQVVPAFISWGVAMLTNPITWIVVGVIALITALILLFTHLEEVGAFFKSVFGAIGDFVGGVVEGIGNAFSGLWETITGIFSGIGQWFGDRFQEAYNFVTSVFENIGNFFRGIWNKITEIFTGVGTAVGDAVGGAFKTVVNGVLSFIESFINSPINLINGFIGLINGAFGFVGVNLGYISTVSLPRLYTGGIVEPNGSGTPIIAGDGGEDEWVVPESKFASLIDQLNERGATGDTYNITVEGVFATSPSEQRKVAEQIVDAIQTIQRQKFDNQIGASL